MYTLVLLIFFFCLPCNSQDSFKPYYERQILEINMIFQIGHIIQPDFTIMNDGRGKLYYEKPGTAKESMQKSRPVNMVIRVTDLNGERKKILTYIIRAKYATKSSYKSDIVTRWIFTYFYSNQKVSMNMENHGNGVKRREFLKGSVSFAAATMFMGLGSSKLFGAVASTQAKSSIPTVALNNGVAMPMLGFGTNTLTESVGTRCVADAISVGYRLIDTAHVYGNEVAVGEGIKQSGINRKELFVTSKLWVDDSGYESSKKAFETSINKLGLDYLDLYLIHRPRGDVKGSWQAMEELFKEGKIKAIGVSNFLPDQLDAMMGYAKVRPAINQIETHVFFQEDKSYEFLKNSETQMEAWSPFAAGRNGIFSNQTLAEIGKKYNKSIAQVCLRWHHQRGIVAIPRSSQKAHMIENLDIFDFELAESDMQTITTLDLNITQFPEWE